MQLHLKFLHNWRRKRGSKWHGLQCSHPNRSLAFRGWGDLGGDAGPTDSSSGDMLPCTECRPNWPPLAQCKVPCSASRTPPCTPIQHVSVYPHRFLVSDDYWCLIITVQSIATTSTLTCERLMGFVYKVIIYDSKNTSFVYIHHWIDNLTITVLIWMLF